MKGQSLDFTTLANAHAQLIFKTLQRRGARGEHLDDLMQDVLIEVHQSLRNFDPGKPIEPWLHGICKNVLKRHWRKLGRVPEAEPDATLEELSSAEANPEQQITEKQLQVELAELLNELDDDTRELIVMHEIDGMSCPEIGDVLGIKEGTVFSRLHTARKKLWRAHERLEARRKHRGGRR